MCHKLPSQSFHAVISSSRAPSALTGNQCHPLVISSAGVNWRTVTTGLSVRSLRDAPAAMRMPTLVNRAVHDVLRLHVHGRTGG